MADAELKVLLSADASNLESAINKVTAELTNLEKVQSTASKAATAGAANTKKAAQANNEAATSAEKNASATKKGASASKENASAAEKEGAAKKSSSSSIDKDTASTEKNTSAKKKNKQTVEEGADSLIKYSENLQKSGKAYKDIGDGLNTLTKPVQIGAAAFAAGGVLAVKSAMDYETAFTAVKKTVDGSDEELNQLSDSIRQMALEIPVAATELANFAAMGGQLGVKTPELENFTKTVAAMGVATNLAGENASTALARIVNVTGESMSNVDRIGSTIVALGNNSATTEAEIAEMAQRLGKFANTVGINSHQVLAYSAALSSMGVEAQAGGSALGRVWMDIETAVANGGSALQAYAKYAGKSADEFKKQWSTDASGAFSGLIEGLSEAGNLTLALSEIGILNTIDQQSVMALANGYDTLTKSLGIASEAYEENNALTNEADAAYATTANQMKLVKNNLVEAGISIGETLLPTVKNITGGIKDFANWLANLDEGAKQNIINFGVWTIGLGAVSKGIVGAVNTIGATKNALGSIAEGIGKLAKASKAVDAVDDVAEASKGLTGLAPLLAKIAPAAGPAALAIAGVTTAVIIGKKAYDNWYDSNYKFTEGLADGNAEISERTSRLKTLESAQEAISKAKLVINNPKSSQEEVENAKQQISDIAEMLAEEYDLHINVDSPNLPEVEKAVESATRTDWNQQQRDFNTQTENLFASSQRANKNSENIQKWKEEAAAAKQVYDQYDGLNTKLDTLQSNYNKGDISQKQYNEGLKNIGKELGYTDEAMDTAIKNGVMYGNVHKSLEFAMAQASIGMNAHSKEIKDYDDSLAQLKKEAESTANQLIENAGRYAEDGNLDQFFMHMKTALVAGQLDLEGYAIAVQNTLSGMSFETAMKNGGDDLENWVNGYIDILKEFGVAIEEFPEGAQFTLNAETENVEILDETGEKLAEIDGKTGEVTVAVNDKTDGVVEGTEQKLSELNGKEVVFGVSADGSQATAVIDGVEYKVLAFNEQTGVASLSADGTRVDLEVNQKTGEVVAFSQEEGTAKLNAIDNVTQTAENAKKSLDSIEDKNITITATFKRIGEWISGLFAKGTQDAPGGLAMINDQKGVSDPRELVEIGGKGYIFEGKDVILPLPKHSKVYTASQTKEIMSAQGIPHYASGKNNEAWEKDKEAWQHQQKTAYVPITAAETLEWLEKMKEKYANDTEVIKEIEEEMVAATKDSWSEWQENLEYSLKMGLISEKEYYDELRKYRDEYVVKDSDEYKDITLELHKGDQDKLDKQNEDSMAWIENRNALNDWDEIGDSAADAYKRIMDRNREAVDAGLITWDEYQKVGNEAFDSLLNGYVDYANDWIDKQKETSGMTAEEELEAIERVEKNVNAFFENLGELTEEQYIVKLAVDAQLAEDKFAAIENRISQWEDDADWYQEQSDVYGWGFDGRGITKTDFLYDKIEHYQTELDTGGLNESQYNETMRKRDEAYLELYQAKDEELEEVLNKQRDAINDLEEALSQQVNDLRSSWEVEDRTADMEEVRRDLEKYEGAATLEGQEKYKELQEELKQLEREEQIYQIEQENAALLKELEDEYADMEADKKELLKEIQYDMGSYAKQLDNNSESITTLASGIQEALKNLAPSQTEQNLNMDITNVISDNVDIDALVSRLISRSTSFYGGGRK